MATQLLALPPEILDTIWACLDKKSLKQLRATSHLCERLSTQLLYRSFSLYPHMRSLERLVAVAESPHLAVHVHQIRYNTLFCGVLDIISSRIHSVWSKDISVVDKQLMLSKVRAEAEQLLLAGRAIDDIAQATYLQRAFACLPNLEDVKVIEGSGYDATLLPSKYTHRYPHFYKQIIDETCGKFEHTRLERGMLGPYFLAEGPYSRPVIMAAHCLTTPLKSLRLQGMTFDRLFVGVSFANRGIIFTKLLKNLKKLTLDSPSSPAFSHPLVMPNLQTMLQQLVNVEELTLIFRRIYEVEVCDRQIEDFMSGICLSYFDIGPTPTNAIKLPARLTWSSSLRKLTLGGLVCTEKDFESILKHCSKSLRSLRLMHGIIIVPESNDDPRVCLVRMLKWIRRHLRLKNFQVCNLFTNGGMQYWEIPEYRNSGPLASDDSLYMRVIKFILEGGECPLEHVAIPAGHHDLHKKTHSYDVPVSLKAVDFGGDDSWSMNYIEEMNEDDDSNLSQESFEFNNFLDGISEDDIYDEDDEMDEFGPPLLQGSGSPPFSAFDNGIPALDDSLD